MAREPVVFGQQKTLEPDQGKRARLTGPHKSPVELP
jgi:hypothetical protein